MTRTTRAALRSRELAEEAANAASVPLPTTPQRGRVPLGEISENAVPSPIMVTIPFEEPVKAVGKKGKGGKGMAKGQKKDKENMKKPEIEVLEDGDESSASSAVDEVRYELRRGENIGNSSLTRSGTTHSANISGSVPQASSQWRSIPATKYWHLRQ